MQPTGTDTLIIVCLQMRRSRVSDSMGYSRVNFIACLQACSFSCSAPSVGAVCFDAHCVLDQLVVIVVVEASEKEEIDAYVLGSIIVK